ncbi:hypothetical protein BASA62_006199 [Batrachochytrium salamandrivorans]|nr:hypothetical protein BASA62_006199 [Batrachochytrium salamandrivorans]
MRTDIESQLKSCPACRRWTITKVGYHPLTPITSEHPMDVIAMDTAKSFPTSPRGNNVLLVCICVFTRFIFLRPLQDNSALAVPLLFSQSLPTLVFLVSSNQTMAQNSLTQCLMDDTRKHQRWEDLRKEP